MAIPSPDMEMLDETNLRTSYAKLFRYIQEDFVTKADLTVMLTGVTRSGIGPPVIPTFGIGESLIAVYEGLVKVGKAALKGAVTAGKAAIGL